MPVLNRRQTTPETILNRPNIPAGRRHSQKPGRLDWPTPKARAWVPTRPRDRVTTGALAAAGGLACCVIVLRHPRSSRLDEGFHDAR